MAANPILQPTLPSPALSHRDPRQTLLEEGSHVSLVNHGPPPRLTLIMNKIAPDFPGLIPGVMYQTWADQAGIQAPPILTHQHPEKTPDAATPLSGTKLVRVCLRETTSQGAKLSCLEGRECPRASVRGRCAIAGRRPEAAVVSEVKVWK